MVNTFANVHVDVNPTNMTAPVAIWKQTENTMDMYPIFYFFIVLICLGISIDWYIFVLYQLCCISPQYYDAKMFINNKSWTCRKNGLVGGNLDCHDVSLNPSHDEVYSIQHYVIKFVSDLWQVGDFSGFLHL